MLDPADKPDRIAPEDLPGLFLQAARNRIADEYRETVGQMAFCTGNHRIGLRGQLYPPERIKQHLSPKGDNQGF
ncbi:hypothetical protein [Nissabacter archeti]|uniref:hypothetical protein n=1 Tax=Nissabacter archeti TaxID=1917880 RepID=UPI000935334D|nr:hypothetical protein [Nissabacter archeti]